MIAVAHAFRGATAVFHSEDVDIYKVDGAEPLARSIDHPKTALEVRVEGNRLVVDTANLPGGGKILVNYLWHSGMRASTGGTELALSADDWNRIVIDVPAGSKTIDATYRIGYQFPFLAGLVLLVAGIYLQTCLPIGDESFLKSFFTSPFIRDLSNGMLSAADSPPKVHEPETRRGYNRLGIASKLARK